MNRETIMEKLTDIFKDVFDDVTIELSDNTTSDDIDDWDSLSHITLIADVEKAFDCKFSMKDLLEMKNVGEMLNRIERIKEA